MDNAVDKSEIEVQEGKAFGLTQTQIAALLGVTPQSISKGMSTDGWSFFSKEKRAQRLYTALLAIGGDRYLLSAEQIKEMSLALGWGALDTAQEKSIRPATLYAESDELWFVSDSPGSIIAWDELRSLIFGSTAKDESGKLNHKIIAFFTKTLEGADRWVEFLEREVLKPAVIDYKNSFNQKKQSAIQIERADQYNCYVFVIVTNTMPFSPDFVISNPGSRCTNVLGASSKSIAYHWNGNSYFPSGWRPTSFINICQTCDIGMSPVKSNFFPRGLILSKNVVDYHPEYTDGMILRSGDTHIESKEKGDTIGEKMAGGILETTLKKSETAIAFNLNNKFCPAFILTYKRRPGDRCKKDGKIISDLQKELVIALKETDQNEAEPGYEDIEYNEEMKSAKKTGLLNF